MQTYVQGYGTRDMTCSFGHLGIQDTYTIIHPYHCSSNSMKYLVETNIVCIRNGKQENQQNYMNNGR